MVVLLAAPHTTIFLPCQRSRAWKSNLLLLAQAVLFILLIWLINQAMEASRRSLPAFSSVENPTPVPVGAIPLCTSSMFLRQDAPCITLAWSPRSAAHGAEVIQQVAANNDPPIPASQLMAFTDADAMDQYMLEHPDTVLSAVEFDPDPLAGAMADFSIDRASAPARRLGYTIQTNSTVQWFKGQFQNPNTHVQLPLQVAIERELVRYMANSPNTPWEVSITTFPHTAAPLSSLIGSVAPTFLLASIMFQVRGGVMIGGCNRSHALAPCAAHRSLCCRARSLFCFFTTWLRRKRVALDVQWHAWVFETRHTGHPGFFGRYGHVYRYLLAWK